MSVTKRTSAPQNASDITEMLAENMRRLFDGETTPAVANAVVNSAATILRVTKQQLDYAKMTGQTPVLTMLLPRPADSE